MNVLERIERGELIVEVLTKTEHNGWHDHESEKLSSELIRLAKIGSASEKCFNNIIKYICGRIYNSSNCKFLRGKKGNNCEWVEFCKARSEVQK